MARPVCDTCMVNAYDATRGRADAAGQIQWARNFGADGEDHTCDTLNGYANTCECACQAARARCDDPGAHRPGCKCDGGEPLL